VVFGEPVAGVAEVVGEAGEVYGVAEGVAEGGVFGDGGLIEDA
jgi:hypothetical protein